MPPSRPSETTAGACTRMPTSIACASCTVRWRTDTASADWRRSRTRNCATWPASRPRVGRPPGPDSGDGSRCGRARRRAPELRRVSHRSGDGSTCGGPAPARAAPRRIDAHAGAGGRRLAPPSREHRAGALDVLDHAEHPRLLPARVRATQRAGAVALCDARGRTPRDSAPLARHCWPPAAAWASPISVPIFPPTTLSRA